MGGMEDIEMTRLGGSKQLVPGTVADAGDMRRMGIAQELNRVFSYITVVGYAIVLAQTWPFSLFTGALTLSNGGPGGVIWVFVGVCIGMVPVVLSMAEMASLEPTAGGQYHWVSEWAPPRYRKIASYMVGWMCVLGWQAGIPGSANVVGTIFGALGVVVNPGYHPQPWHGVVITIAILTVALIFNIFLSRKLPGLEGVVVSLYILGCFAIVMVLLIMGPKADPKDVFGNFQDNAGWGSIGTGCFVSISGPVMALFGADCAVHLAEEVKDASRQLPKAMILASVSNYIIGFLTLVALAFTVGDNLQEVLDTPTGQPWVQILWNATQSKTPTIIFMVLVCCFLTFSAINTSVASSRQFFAFARDGGLPFSGWIRRVSPTHHVPINAVLLSWLISCLIALIPLGSPVAFTNIQNIAVIGLQSSYVLCILARLYHRNFGPSPYGNLSHPPPFFLGHRLGNILNVAALLVLICFVVAVCFPPVPKPTIESMNWSSVALSGTIFVALLAYMVRGKEYLGPNTKIMPSEGSAEETIRVQDKKS